MTNDLTTSGYDQTKQKLANMKARREALLARQDIHPTHRQLSLRSYDKMMRQYQEEIELYEAQHKITATESETATVEK